MISDPVALNHVLERRSYDYPKQKDAARVLRRLMGSGLLVSEGECREFFFLWIYESHPLIKPFSLPGVQHRRQKQAIQPAFSPSKLKSLTPIFSRDSRRLRDKLLAKISSESSPIQSSEDRVPGKITVDVLRPISRATLNIPGHAGFGTLSTHYQKKIQIPSVKLL